MAKKNTGKGGLLSVDVTVAENRRARFDYFLEERFVAGMMLTGTEIKSLRHGQCSLNEAHVGPRRDEIWLYNCHIAEYKPAGAHLQHAPTRPRKLLLHRKEIHKLSGAVKREGYTIVPTKIYFNGRGLAKIEIALAKGKKLHDKRATEKDRDWGREKRRLLRDRG
ncbi:MAG TPA: SsrA-binding protein SmpB [Patescibacteria group bacterium]|jgi:SsrA-binding protein|nr:SsrA-binding protein SmpB [Patescibacteria group bacterium]